MSDKSSDEEFLQQALPVENYDPKQPPDASQIILSANDYLRYVRHESLQYPDVLIAERLLPMTTEPEINQPELIYNKTPENSVSVEWRMVQAKLFVKAMKEFKTIKDNIPFVESEIVPLSKPLEAADCLTWFSENAPRLSVIIPCSQAQLILLLETILQFCSSTKWIKELEPWIYSILLALEQPLHPNSCFTLRRLAKSLRKMVSKLQIEEAEDTVKYCEVIISIIAFVFGQKDLIE